MFYMYVTYIITTQRQGCKCYNQWMEDERTTPPAQQAAGPLLDEQAGRLLFKLVRLLGRPREFAPTSASGQPVDLSRILVVQALHTAIAEGGPAAEISVGTVAAQLAIDPSTASRFVADALHDGFLRSTASATDARRRCLALTPAGEQLAAAAYRYQQEIFATATQDWPEAERAAFARQFIRFATQLLTLQDAEPSTAPNQG